jgi:hypothetical protein
MAKYSQKQRARAGKNLLVHESIRGSAWDLGLRLEKSPGQGSRWPGPVVSPIFPALFAATARKNAMIRLLISALLLIQFAVLSATALAADSTDIATERSRLRLASVPEKPPGVVDLIQQLKSQPARPGQPKSREVTIVGQIGGMPNPWNDTHPDFPWFAGQGSFFLVDAKVAGQFAKHANHHGGDHNCAFCQNLAAKNARNIAVVNLVDGNGEIIKIDARELLGLEENQRVVVRGRAELLGGTMLVLHADGVHILR